jgi:hypothetical protein
LLGPISLLEATTLSLGLLAAVALTLLTMRELSCDVTSLTELLAVRVDDVIHEYALLYCFVA